MKKKLEGKITKLAQPRQKIENHPARTDNYRDLQYLQVPIDVIHPNPDQPRKYFNEESLNELAESIKQRGVLQPVIVRIGKDKKIYLVAGERRFRASKIAELTEIPAIYTTGAPSEIALIENLQREDLKPVEEAEALDHLMKEHNYTQEKLALVVGKARTTITETLSLNKLPTEIKNECRESNNYSRRVLVEVAKQKNSKIMISLFDVIKKRELKSTDVRRLTRKPPAKPQKTPAGITIERVVSLTNNLNKIDLKTIEKSEKQDLKEGLKNLKTIIERLLK